MTSAWHIGKTVEKRWNLMWVEKTTKRTHKNCNKIYRIVIGVIYREIKKPRAYGECLGANRRRRTQ